ncbi:MAG: GAF domain-containing protein [Bacteroidales bacterium]|jgi:L-methionine (R)-S-oxide reductase|nr:GAF domain-containing protein [Bacteroidales bacterium]
MDNHKKAARYDRVYQQVSDLITDINNPISRMATISAILHHKFDYYFWTGFYLLNEAEELLVGPYQGPLACLKLKPHTGVCWAGIDNKAPIVVEDVHSFPGHIACSSKSQSEIVVPLYDTSREIIGVLDVDSETKNTFNEIDEQWLTKICELIFKS